MLISKSIITAILVLLAWAGTGFCSPQQSDELMLVTNDFPPYAFEENGRITGIAARIVTELMARTAYNGKMIMLPWSRALKYSKDRKMMLFPYMRRPYREKNFKWIGPIMQDCLVFAVPASEKQIFRDIDAFKSLSVGVNDGTPTFVRLKTLDFKHLQVVPTERQNARKLVSGNRIDAWFAPYLIMMHTLKSAGIDESSIRIAFHDLDVEMYIGASLQVPDETIALWQQNFDAMKSDGSYQRIIETSCLKGK